MLHPADDEGQKPETDVQGLHLLSFGTAYLIFPCISLIYSSCCLHCIYHYVKNAGGILYRYVQEYQCDIYPYTTVPGNSCLLYCRIGINCAFVLNKLGQYVIRVCTYVCISYWPSLLFPMQACTICAEPFVQFWEEDLEEWHFRDAVREDGKVSSF